MDDMRVEALRQAVAACDDFPHEEIVRAAEAFLAFLRGESARGDPSLEQLMHEG